MRIPEQKIEEIRNSADIVDVISGHVHLRKRGKNFVGLCPFHQEKTPSFTVSEDKQIYHCFGCGAGGNVFKFLMELKNISFVEAVEEIAEHLGIKIDYESHPSDAQQNELEELYELNILAARFFSDNLLKSTDGEDAREYLKGRNIKQPTQKIFGIGYAPYGWDNFLAHAKENKVDLTKAKLLGLIDINDKGEYYDKFRGRIIFPIFSPNGRVIAFGGRILENQENAAKYLNSPESQIYSKRRSLYGLFHSKDDIRKLDRAILVEGYMDLISLYQAGVKNVVASSGTSLTEDQVQLLSRFTKNIIILFDADPAGQKASLRSIEILLKQDFEVKVIALPKGEDPDSYIIKYGREKFEEEVSRANNFLEYQTAQFEEQGLFEDPAEMTKAIRELVKTLALVNDEIKRNILARSLAKKFGLREKLIESELLNYIDKAKEEKQSKVVPTVPINVSSTEELTFAKEISIIEKEIIRILFMGNPQFVSMVTSNISLDDLTNPSVRTIASIAYESENEETGVNTDVLISKIKDEPTRIFVSELVLKELSTWQYAQEAERDNDRWVFDHIKNFKKIKLDAEIQKYQNIIEQTGGIHDDIELLSAMLAIKKEIVSLSKKNAI